MSRLGIGLVGSGFMGRAHALAFRTVGGVFELPLEPELELLADIDEASAAAAASRLGFVRSTSDWQALVDDSRVDLVAITAPNTLHKPIALAAIACGKPVYCEKPLASNVSDAKVMRDAAEAAEVTTLVGFNYLKNPITALAHEVVASGEIGEVIGFRGVHAEDYMADPSVPISWRHEPAGGGVTADLGSHIISMARYLVGEIEAVCAQLDTVFDSRPVAPGASERGRVEVDDQANVIIRFAGGASGSIHASWLASGRNMQLAYEIVGTKGSLAFTQERLNELKIFSPGQARGRAGFKTLTAGPDHPDYGNFCPAPGHQLGFNDLKTIEVKHLIEALAGKIRPFPDFREAWEVERVVAGIHRSAADEAWVRIKDV